LCGKLSAYWETEKFWKKELCQNCDEEGVTPYTLNEVLRSLEISYKCFNILNEVLSSFVGKKGILIAYMTDSNHFYPVDDQEDRKKIAARHREGNKAGGRKKKKKNEEEEEYTIKPSMDVALYEDVTGKVYLSEQDNLNMEIVEQMSSENLIYFRGHYHLDSEGNIRELEYSNDVRFIANEKVKLTVGVCEKLGIPFVGQSYVSLGLDILDDKHKIGGKLKKSVLNNDLYNSFRRSCLGAHNQTFGEVKNIEDLRGYDIVKQHTYILATGMW